MVRKLYSNHWKIIAKNNRKIQKNLSKRDPLRQLLLWPKPVGGVDQLSSSGGQRSLGDSVSAFCQHLRSPTSTYKPPLIGHLQSISTPSTTFGYLHLLAGSGDWLVCAGAGTLRRGWQGGGQLYSQILTWRLRFSCFRETSKEWGD